MHDGESGIRLNEVRVERVRAYVRGDVAKWLRQGFAKPLFGGSIPPVASNNNDLDQIDLPDCGTGASVAGDRSVLTALYHATGGGGWVNNRGWLSDKSLGDWRGVRAEDGRVTCCLLHNVLQCNR